MRVLGFLGVALILATSSVALAQTEPEVVYEKHTKIVLEGQVIDGGVERPSGSMFNIRKRTRFGTMVVVRSSFALEILGSASDL